MASEGKAQRSSNPPSILRSRSISPINSSRLNEKPSKHHALPFGVNEPSVFQRPGFTHTSAKEAEAAESSCEAVATMGSSSSWSRLAADSWAWELGSISISMITLASICLVLSFYDGKPVPRLPPNITLNAIISFLAAISKAALMVTVAAVIGQNKWLWFNEPQKLCDIQTFEDASRGPAGSLNLLWSRKVGLITGIACLIVILSIGFDPFFQQLIIYPQKAVPSTTEYPSFKVTWPNENSYYLQIPLISPDQLVTAVNSAIYDQGSRTRWEPSCRRGGVCEWRSYDTLAVCGGCQDVTNQIFLLNSTISSFNQAETEDGILQSVVTIQNDSYGVPNRSGFPVTVPLRIAASQLGKNNSETEVSFLRSVIWSLPTRNGAQYFHAGSELSNETYVTANYAGLQNPLVAIGQLKIEMNNNTNSLTIRAASECALSLCASHHNISVNDTQVSASLLSFAYTPFDSSRFKTSTMPVDGTEVNLFDDSGTLQNIAYAVYSTILGNITRSGSMSCSFDKANQTFNQCSYFEPQPTKDTYSTTQIEILDESAYNITDVFEYLINAINDQFFIHGNNIVYGNILITDIYVQIRWRWVTFPLVLILLGLFSLLWTINKSFRDKSVVWKLSSLPYLYHSPYVKQQEKSGSWGSGMHIVSNMERQASQVKVSFRFKEQDRAQERSEKTNLLADEGGSGTVEEEV